MFSIIKQQTKKKRKQKNAAKFPLKTKTRFLKFKGDFYL